MPKGPLGFPRLTEAGPFVDKTENEEWDELMQMTEEQMKEYGFGEINDNR